jgi:predicted RND superfamily exporter protein
MRDRFLKKIASWHAHHPWRMLIISLILTVVLGGLSSRLTITMRTQDLLPEKDPKVVQFNTIIEEFSTATNLVVVVQGEEDRIKTFADFIAPRILGLTDTARNAGLDKQIGAIGKRLERLRSKGGSQDVIEGLEAEIRDLEGQKNFKLFQRIDYKIPLSFLRRHALMLVKAEDLQNTKDVFTNPNLIDLVAHTNDSMEKEYVGREESISTREKEDGAVNFLDGIRNFLFLLGDAATGEDVSDERVDGAVDKLLFGDPYFISYDKSALIINAIPNFTLMDRDLIMSSVAETQKLLDGSMGDFSDIQAGLSGTLAKEYDEQIHSAQSLGYTTLFAFAAILVLLILSFKMWVAPLFAVINLLVGLIWAMGANYLAVGQLNMLTSVMSVVLLGLGIDFSIHLISGFTEWRAAGENVPAAMEKTFVKSGRGIVTGAFTTAFAFLSLLISQTRGMRELGIVVGVGLLSVLLSTMLFLPSLLSLRGRSVDHRRAKKNITVRKRDISFRFLGRVASGLARRPLLSITASLLITAFLVWSALRIKYDQNYLNLEPKGLTSIALMDTVMEKFDLSMDYALVLAESIQESRDLAERYREIGTTAITDDISTYIPTEEEHARRLPHVEDIRRQMTDAKLRPAVAEGEIPLLIREIRRLEMNIMEMQDMAFIGGQDKVDGKCKTIVGDPEKPGSPNMLRDLLALLESRPPQLLAGISGLQRRFAPRFKEIVLGMCGTEEITLADLPPSVQDRYANQGRDLFLVTVYPSGSIYDGVFLNRFVDDLERVSEKATGIPPLSTALIRIFARDGRNAVLLTIVVVFLLLCVDFRSILTALLAMIPLAAGAFWMVGLMRIFGIPLDFMNIMGLPLIIGIGIDDGVHILHRWNHEGRSRIRTVFSSTGKAIFLTSLTTMLAFGSMMFSVFPAWTSFGSALFIGVGACFLTSVLILPGPMGLLSRKAGKTD